MGVKRVLLVEDETDIAEILALVLEGAGYAVDTAGTVAQARQRLDQSTYTLVNTDLRLPDGNGSETRSPGYFLLPSGRHPAASKWRAGSRKRSRASRRAEPQNLYFLMNSIQPRKAAGAALSEFGRLPNQSYCKAHGRHTTYAKGLV
jgi:hypothetical protein